MKHKFEHFEIVKIQSEDPELSEVNGLTGVILGISESEDSNEVAYSVDITKLDCSWFIFEEDLISLKKFAKKEDFYSGESIRVRVDPETGEGEIVEDKED